MIPLVKPFLPPKTELLPALEEILYSGYIAEGEVVKDFERLFSQYIKNPYSLSVNSGTAALHLAFMLMGLKKGDEVISTALTAEPTNVAITLTGAKVVWADVDPNNGLIDAVDIRTKISEKTRAIVVVHYAGMVANLAAIHAVAKEFNIPVLEDAAHALGAKYEGKYIGSISPYTIFSFQAIKHMTTVDGGMLTLSSAEAHTEARLRRWFGLDKTKTRMDNDITLQGHKYHMNNVNATIGIVQMKYLKDIVARHIKNGKQYDHELQGIAGLQLVNYYPGAEASYWLYTLMVDDRDGFIRKLAENGVQASELHKRNDTHSIFKESKARLPNLDIFYEKLVHLPCGWWVGNEEIEKIIGVIKSGW